MSRCSSDLRECECYLRPIKVRNILINDYRMSLLAVYSLVIAQPGPIFGRSDANIYESDITATSHGFTEKAEPGMSTTQQTV